ncbi:sulfate adenylyltransferase subunit CysN [Legionella londiniensis]|uniref:Multifunctional fusion protein n=1 Tax=Legionella londiniensis TaxID=45068 RepID=A0A0W0VKN3_9GAMM|nr:sulfate adenylyltransferase subunit CysN [Legionella londiniensis]KTD20667.1 elongation factor Tu (EF-Tu) [Legionella londiniensis]STX92861.1 elongation factor Tu (EF-Tu) [Legionella londiniensis]
MKMKQSSIAHTDFTSYLNAHDQKDILRFITCGSVDDGKSTLIGRLLYESQLIYDDQLKALASDSKKYGTTGEELDFALLVDGLASEREQGITIDVAYRFFSTDKRKFIVADTPGHEQYTRNMATGASTASLAVLMIDARKGILTQTRRHSFIVAMLGVKNIVLAINKMDLVDYDKALFEQIKTDYCVFAETLGIKEIQAIPISALKGDNIIALSPNMPWYQESSLLNYLENVQIENNFDDDSFRMPVQWVNRPNPDFRGFSGRISSGQIRPGDTVRILPGNQKTTIDRLITYEGELTKAIAGQSITCTLHDELDISRGNVLVSAQDPCEVADQFAARILWMAEKPMISGRQYVFKSHTVTALCTPGKPKHRINVNTLEKIAARELTLNEIGDCDLALDRAIAFEPYSKNRELGSFIMIDRFTNETVAAGLIHFALRRSTNVHQQPLLVDKNQRALIKNQKPAVLWFTGLSGAGKSTIANLVEAKLNAAGKHTMLLDGDNIRHGLNRDLDFTEAGRAENIRRIAEVAKLMTEAGLITLVSFISPFKAEREMARRLIGDKHFLEIFVHTPLAIAEGRDVKGLYKKARAGIIKNFTGIGSPYEEPVSPALKLTTTEMTPEEAATKVMHLLTEFKFI